MLMSCHYYNRLICKYMVKMSKVLVNFQAVRAFSATSRLKQFFSLCPVVLNHLLPGDLHGHRRGSCFPQEALS
jgi:hypothetical protein